MHFTSLKILLVLRRCALTSIYGAFFLVHLFCFTGHDNVTVSTTSPNYHSEPGKQKTIATKNDRNKKTKIRLNKRFQPAIADLILHPESCLPIKYIDVSNPAKPKDYLLISFILAASLRGPPTLS